MLRWRSSARWSAVFLCGVLGVGWLALAPSAARAGGFLDFLFGGLQDAPVPPAPVNSYAEPSARLAPAPVETVHDTGGSTGRAVAFCVRLCDGENFPMEHFANATPIETCRSLCPASRTKVFFGSSIESAVARDGARYADLDNAYLYRKHLVAHCTCNGRDAFGLAPFEKADDPTLRPGDIVVTRDGLVSYTGKRGQVATYRPVDPSTIATQLNSVTSPVPVAQRGVPADREEPRVIAESENAPPQYLPPVVDLRGQVGR